MNSLFFRLCQTRVLGRAKAFCADTNGAFAVIFGVMAVVLIALGGAGVDYTLWQNALTTARNNADAGALAGAISEEENLSKLKTIVTGAASQGAPLTTLSVTDVTYDKKTEQVEVRIEGTYQTQFITLMGVHTLPVIAVAASERAQSGGLEVALVLDNTWSMSDKDESGQPKINALKAASLNLVSKLWVQDKKGTVKIGLVPYADYVNVGVNNRYQPWISVPADYSETKPPSCTMVYSEKYNCKYGPYYSCPYYVDGVRMERQCRDTLSCDTRYFDPPKQSCNNGSTTPYKWFGCVRSRNVGNARLNDAEPHIVYRGYPDTSQKCLNPIVPLTTNQGVVKSNLAQMITNIGTGYRPLTYIPAGMVWGINLLSPTAPFIEGAAYDPANLQPRKALILMTDGDNTMYYNASDGRHLDNGTNVNTAANRKKKTDEDTMALCNYAKQQKIEVFTVSFGTLLPASDALLRNCSSGANHYFSAANAKELDDAFQKIADSLELVRLTR